jgi:hypothetical protein
MMELVWFNISVMYSAICAALAVESTAGTKRLVFVFLAVHGGLWAIYRAMLLVKGPSETERR